MRRLAAALLAACAFAGAPRAHADALETDPDLAGRDADYAAGRQAVEGKHWAEAVARLRLAQRRHPDSADLHNYLGFAHRHLGQFELALEHYRRAIAIDPRHRGAHEYIGETYLLIGDLSGAERHLQALRAICLLPCDELADLERAVGAYRQTAESRRKATLR